MRDIKNLYSYHNYWRVCVWMCVCVCYSMMTKNTPRDIHRKQSYKRINQIIMITFARSPEEMSKRKNKITQNSHPWQPQKNVTDTCIIIGCHDNGYANFICCSHFQYSMWSRKGLSPKKKETSIQTRWKSDQSKIDEETCNTRNWRKLMLGTGIAVWCPVPLSSLGSNE